MATGISNEAEYAEFIAEEDEMFATLTDVHSHLLGNVQTMSDGMTEGYLWWHGGVVGKLPIG